MGIMGPAGREGRPSERRMFDEHEHEGEHEGEHVVFTYGEKCLEAPRLPRWAFEVNSRGGFRKRRGIPRLSQHTPRWKSSGTSARSLRSQRTLQLVGRHLRLHLHLQPRPRAGCIRSFPF